uniref:Uncharacterized protein n=1 Tax=Ditylenchus dipsaci TaxID=166011 RepID=A0A915EM33_9BILA
MERPNPLELFVNGTMPQELVKIVPTPLDAEVRMRSDDACSGGAAPECSLDGGSVVKPKRKSLPANAGSPKPMVYVRRSPSAQPKHRNGGRSSRMLQEKSP